MIDYIETLGSHLKQSFFIPIFFFQAVRMIFTIVIVYILLTLPYHIIWQLNTFGIKNALAKKFSVLFLTATSASHPIIYGTLHQEFSRGFKAILRCSKTARNDFLTPSARFTSAQGHECAGHIPVQCRVVERRSENNLSFAESVQKITVV